MEEDRRRAVLGLLGLARRAGALRLGSGPVLRALQEEPPGLVFLARDAGADLAARVMRERGKSVVDDTLLGTTDLAEAFGRGRLSVVSVHEKGFVSGLQSHLSDSR